MKEQLLKINFWIVLAVDCLLLLTAHLLAYYIRFEGDISAQLHNIRTVLPWLLYICVMTV